MSDTTDTGGEAVIDTPATAGAETPPAAPPAADPFEDEKVQTFDRQYVERLRKEAAGHRTKHTPYEEAFGDYSEEDRAVFLDLAKTFAADPVKGTERFEQLAAGLRKQYPGEKTPTAEELKAEAGVEGDPAEKPMTRSELDAYMKEQRETEATEAAVKSITAEVSAAYPAGTSEHREVLWLAANKTGGDIKAALAMQAEKEQAIVDKFLTGKKAQAGGAHPVTGHGDPSGDSKTPKTWKDARAASMARIAAAQA